MGLFSQLATQPVYNTRAVVLRTGVPADTFRAWERRYGVPLPARTHGNQRRYSDRDIAMIAWLRDQTRSGMTISQAIELFKSRESFEDSTVAPATAARADASSDSADAEALSRYATRLVTALAAYDSTLASQLLEEALAFVPVEDVCLDVLQPAMHEFGRLWQRGDVLVSAEHFATSFAIRRLGTLFHLSRPEQGRGPLVAACLEGELHEAGLLMTSLFLSRSGCHVVYLGPNQPVDDLIETIQAIRPPLLLLSASTSEAAIDLARSSHEIKDACRALGTSSFVPEIGFGGQVFTQMPFLQDGVNGIFCGRDADAAVATVEALLAALPGEPVGA